MNESYRIEILGVALASAGIICDVQSIHQPMEDLKADNAARLYERVGISSIDSIGSGKTTMTLAHGNSFEAEIGEVDPEGNMGSNGCLRNIDSFQTAVSISFSDNVKDATVYGGNSFGSYSEVEQDLDAGDYDLESQVEYFKIEWDFSLNWNDVLLHLPMCIEWPIDP